MRFEKVLINVAFMAMLLYFLWSAACITELWGNVRICFLLCSYCKFYGICMIQRKLNDFFSCGATTLLEPRLPH